MHSVVCSLLDRSDPSKVQTNAANHNMVAIGLHTMLSPYHKLKVMFASALVKWQCQAPGSMQGCIKQ